MVYVLNVVTGKEDVVIRYIELLNHENIKKVYKPLSVFQKPNFPGYLFVELDYTTEVYYALKELPNVLYFIDPNRGAIPLKEKEEGSIKNENERVSLIGKPVKVISGIYEGTTGCITAIKYPYFTIQAENLYNLASAPELKIHLKHLMLVETTLEPGDKIVIKDGEYAGITGIIEQINYPDAVISADIFGQEVALIIPISQLERRDNDDYGHY